MSKTITDKKKIDEVLERGVEKIYPNKKALEKKLLKGEKIRLYCGFDPSASALHIGNAILINKLAQFQALGHEVIFLIGDFTGMIGDPTDKSSVRKKMTRKQVLDNSKNYKKQAGAYLNFSGKNPAKVMYNSKWSDKLSFRDLLEISSNFTVQQMIQREMFRERLLRKFECDKCGNKFFQKVDVINEVVCDNKKCEAGAGNIKEIEGGNIPIYLHEFLYPLAQGYDSVAMDVDLEIGGNDQMFNMMAGRDLMKAMGKKEKFVMTMKLLADDKGAKMGKTEGNAVFLDETPENMYGIIMSWPDGVISIAFELCTQVAMDEVDKIKKQLKDGKTNPRDLKMKLAFEITKLVHGEKKVRDAQEHFIKTIQKKEIPTELKVVKLKVKNIGVKRDERLVGVLVNTDLAISYSEARRLIQQGGIKVDGRVVKDINTKVKASKKGVVIQRGKRQFVRVILS